MTFTDPTDGSVFDPDVIGQRLAGCVLCGRRPEVIAFRSPSLRIWHRSCCDCDAMRSGPTPRLPSRTACVPNISISPTLPVALGHRLVAMAARVPRLTTPRPSPLPVNVDGIPAVMRAALRWVLWIYTWREPHNGKPGKWTKPPYMAVSPDEPAYTTDPRTWGGLDDALRAYHGKRCDGIGFVFVLEDGFVGLDVDGTNASEYVQLLNSYTEVHPPVATGFM